MALGRQGRKGQETGKENKTLSEAGGGGVRGAAEFHGTVNGLLQLELSCWKWDWKGK